MLSCRVMSHMCELSFSRRTKAYFDISAELVEARVDLTSFDMYKAVTTSPEEPVKISELPKSPARNTKANYDKYRSKYEQSMMSQDHCQNVGQSKYYRYIVIR